jgi:hypothetical protein
MVHEQFAFADGLWSITVRLFRKRVMELAKLNCLGGRMQAQTQLHVVYTVEPDLIYYRRGRRDDGNNNDDNNNDVANDAEVEHELQ